MNYKGTIWSDRAFFKTRSWLLKRLRNPEASASTFLTKTYSMKVRQLSQSGVISFQKTIRKKLKIGCLF